MNKKNILREILTSSIITIILFIIAYFWQVKPQIDLAMEGLELTRPTKIIVRVEPDRKLKLSSRIIVSNIGTAKVENVTVNMGLFLYSKNIISTIYSLADNHYPYSSDANRTPREKLFPRLLLDPNSDYDITDKFNRLFYQLYWKLISTNKIQINENLIIHDLNALRLTMNCKYLLLIDLSYKRNSDYTSISDTLYFWYDSQSGLISEVLTEVGGKKAINQILQYIENGPENILIFTMDEYQFWQKDFFDISKRNKILSFHRDVNF